MTTITTEITNTTFIFRSKSFTCPIYNWSNTSTPSPPPPPQSSQDMFREYKQLQHHSHCLHELILLCMQPSRVLPPAWSANDAARDYWCMNMKKVYVKLVAIRGELDELRLFSMVEAVKLLMRA